MVCRVSLAAKKGVGLGAWLGFLGCCTSMIEAREEREGGGEVELHGRRRRT